MIDGALLDYGPHSGTGVISLSAPTCSFEVEKIRRCLRNRTHFLPQSVVYLYVLTRRIFKKKLILHDQQPTVKESNFVIIEFITAHPWYLHFVSLNEN